jgi:hypothetical protein
VVTVYNGEQSGVRERRLARLLLYWVVVHGTDGEVISVIWEKVGDPRTSLERNWCCLGALDSGLERIGRIIVKRFAFVLAFVMGLLAVSVVSAATVYVSVTTDKTTYVVGETVHWAVRAYSSVPLHEPPDSGTFPDNHGIALLKVDLAESKGEALSAGEVTEIESGHFQFTNTAYGKAQGFFLENAGTPTVVPGGLQDMVVWQIEDDADYPVTYDVGNDNTPHILAQGSYTATATGTHTLSATMPIDPFYQTNTARYWPDHSALAHNPIPFENAQGGSVQFTVNVAPPVADAGADSWLYESNTCHLNGTGSTGATSYLWEQTGGKTVTIVNPTTATPSFVAPTVATLAEAQLTFKLTVTNGGGNDEDTVSVRVYMRGDADHDDTVGILDFGVWKKQYNHQDPGTTGDFDGQNGVDILDFGIWKTNYNALRHLE